MFLLDLRVVVAEDDSLLRDLMTLRLRAVGCNVAEASTGEEASTLLIADRGTDVLVTDIFMPGPLDGWSLAELSRGLNPKIAVVYTSSRGPNELRRVPGSIFLPKPYHPDELIAAVRKVALPVHLGRDLAG